MADPVSILGLVSTCLTITMRTATVGKDLYTLKSKLKSADKNVRQLSVHVSAIKVATKALSSWLEDEARGSDEVEEVRTQVFDVLSACSDLLSELQDHVVAALAHGEVVGFKGAVSYLWNEDAIKESLTLLHQQETAILLILKALSKISKAGQKQELAKPSNRHVLEQAKRPSSSLFGGDQRSSLRFSTQSDGSGQSDKIFTFDIEVMASTAYRNNYAALLRRNKAVINQQARPESVDRPSFVMSDEYEIKTSSRDHAVDGRSTPMAQSSEASSTTEMDAEGHENSVDVSKREDWPLMVEPSKVLPDAPKPAPQEPKSPLARRTTGFFCRAVFDYHATSSAELNFQQGDVMEIITQLESGWWDVIHKGLRGWIPSNYCQLAEPGDNLSSSDEDSDRESAGSDQPLENEASGFWIPQAMPDGRLFYFNTLTGESTMELPV